MNLLADEGVDRQIVAHLRKEGHSVAYVAEMEPGVSDDAVLELANKEFDALLTADKDFGELAIRQGRLTSCVVLIRLAGLSPESKARITASAIGEHATDLTPGTFAVVTSSAVRIRRSTR